MNILTKSIASVLPNFRHQLVWLANEVAEKAVTLFLPNQLTPSEDGKDHWVQLSPFGDFGNRTGAGANAARCIQRFQKSDAEQICNEFNSAGRRITQPFGMPFYVGHPDHPRFKGQPGHTDTAAKGRGKEMEVRYDKDCVDCTDFANASSGASAPCHKHGLFVKVHWNHDGEQLLANESFHGHSVNWAALPSGMEGGVQIYRPVRVKSAGFTNEPGIPVKPASLANEESSEGDSQTGKSVVPPRLKILAGYKADEDCTMEQVLDSLEKAKTGIANEAQLSAEGISAGIAAILLANDDPKAADDEKKGFLAKVHDLLGTDPASGKEGALAAIEQKAKKAGLMDKVKKARDEADKAAKKHWQARDEMEQALANERAAHGAERKARSTDAVNHLVASGKIVTKDKDARITDLCNAGDQFDAKLKEFANAGQQVKTTSITRDLPRAQAVAAEGERQRLAQFMALMDKREREFPNESYDARYTAVASSSEGSQLFAQMSRPGDDKE